MAVIDFTMNVNVQEVDFNVTSDQNTIAFTYVKAESGTNINTINSIVAGEPTGSDVVMNVVSLTQAEYDGGTKIPTTYYIITD